MTILQSIQGDPYCLAGHTKRHIRQALMLELTGEKRPIAKCGTNALWAELKELFELPESSQAAQLAALREIANQQKTPALTGVTRHR